MLKTRSLKKAVSFLCVFCLLFSMLANGVIASADIGEAAAEEAAIGQSSSAGANEESLPDEDPEGDLTGSFEKPGDPAEAELPEEGGQDENEALTEAAAPEEKKSDFPPVEENASDDGNEAAPPCPQEEPAIGMEEAGAIGEAVPPAEASAGAREVRAAASSDLADFLVGVSIDAPMDENGNIVINPNCSYEMTLRFSENEGLQFDDEGVLFYNFPEGVLINDIGPTAFTLAVKDENGSAVVNDNLFEVVGGQLRVRFNQNDPNFARLKAMPNVQFDITISSSFDQTLGEIVFNENIVKDFVFEETSDLAIAKRVVYDKNSDTAYYELQIRSEGLNRNVVIEDRLIGTALHFNRDAVVESSVNGPLSVTPDYQAVENGFRVTIPQMVDGEVLTIRCSAAVDNNLITGSGTAAQTKNTATVVSDDVPEGKTAEADFAGQVDFQKIGKGKAGDPVSIGENRYTVPWTVRVNADHKLTIGGKTILDYVRSDSQQFMHFAGGGITMEVTFADGTTENRFVPWAALGTVSNENGIIRWEYDAPESDGNAAYLITYDTIIDAAGVPSETLTVTNRAQVESHYADASVTVGVIGNDQLLIRKDAVGTTSAESEWTITLTVPGSGLPDLRVVDDMPRLDHGGQTYIDDYVPDSMQIEGLQEGESWNLYVGTNGRSYTLTFYQDEAHVQRGVLPTADGEPRDIVIRFKTRVNQDWLNLAAEQGYNYFYLHRNAATARTGGYTSPTAAASVIPVKPNLVKSVVERSNAEIDGVTYPVFRYSLALFGPVEDGIVIQDSFNTAYLKLFEAEGVWILGGNSYSPTDGNGIVSAVDTPEGMAITVTSFPKQANGSFYPYYLVDYSLIVRDAAALAALNEAAAASQNGIDLENTARWNDLLSARVVNYTYFPYVDKALLTRPTAENGYIAEFEVIINQYAEDLDPASDVLAIQDVLSPNLRLIHDSLTITPASNSLIVQYEEETNTLIFTEVPDETTFLIRYQARVLGTGNVTYSNTIKFGNYEKTIEETAVVDSSGGGTGSNPSITLVKRDSEMLSVLLAGATFQLFWLENGNPVPVQDGNGQDVTFTTGADGKALIVGNLQSLGWALWANRTYCLLETVSPPGYELNTEPIYFILTENPSSQIEFDITGDSLSVQNEAMKISVPVAKYWVGPVAANEVVVHLLADETDTGKTITLNEEGNWTGSFDNLKKYDDAGREIRYSVKEDPVNNYAVQYDGSIEEGYTITNIVSETIGIPVVKQWVGPAAERVAIRLLADGTVIEEITLDAAGGWQHTFTDLPKYDGTDGHEIQYDVQEAPSAGYDQSRSGSVETGFTFTNTITGRVSIPVTKQWVGPAGEQAAIRLLADGTVIEEITLDAAGGWQHTFTDLPKYDGTDGHEIQYDVQEVPSAGYEQSRSGSVETGFTFTNTITGRISIPVTKQWVGPAGEQAAIRLLADGTVIEEITLDAAGGWQHTFTDLPKYDGTDGHEIQYDVQEVPSAGYEQSRSGSVETGFTFTNTITGRISIPVTKQWVGPAGEQAAIRLLADGAVIEEITLDAANGWRHTFTDLPKYDGTDGHRILYDVQELPSAGYEQSRSGSVETGFTFTNTITGRISIPVTKQWVGPAAERATIRLLADGAVIEEITLNAASGWRHTFTDLPKYDGTDGHEIQYDVQEVPSAGYDQSRSGSVETGFTFTNTITGRISIPVTKQWVGPAGEQAAVRLLADGAVIEEITLDAVGGWQHTFTDLPKYDGTDGHEIQYDVQEAPSAGYDQSRSGSVETGFTFTNTITGRISIPVTKLWIGPAGEQVTVELLADGVKIAEAVLSAACGWQYTFTGLDKYRNHTEIVYTIREVGADGYAARISGDQSGYIITNTSTETIGIPVAKQWVGFPGESVTIRLLADGAEISRIVLNAANGWRHTFTDLPKYSSTDGHRILYDVQELPSAGYEQSRSGSVETGFTFTNTITGRISIPVTKLWIGPAAERVTVELLADGVKVAEAVLSAACGWQYTFTGLDKYRNHTEIVYTIREVGAAGYAARISGDQSGYIITNTSTETIGIPAAKQWVGSPGESVTLRLLADGAEISRIVLNAANGWRHTFTDLPKYSSTDGHRILYDVQELPSAGYEQSRSGSVETGFTFTNTAIDQVSIPVKKTWIGPAEERVTVELLADGVKVAEAVLSEAGGWQHTFTGLDKYRNHTEIVYTIREVGADGYAGRISGDQSGYTITNINTETIGIPVTKQWVGSPGESVTIRLLADGAELARIELSGENEWRHTFNDLPKYNSTDGHEIRYTISEDALNGYTASITGDAHTGFVVTNTKTAPPPPPDTPRTGDGTHMLFYFIAMMLSGAGLIWLLLLGKKRARKQK